LNNSKINHKSLVPTPQTAAIGFKKYFNTNNIFVDGLLSAATHKYCLDIIKLDDWLKVHHRYTEEKHGSMSDFIKLKFGNEADAFIEDLLNYGGLSQAIQDGENAEINN